MGTAIRGTVLALGGFVAGLVTGVVSLVALIILVFVLMPPGTPGETMLGRGDPSYQCFAAPLVIGVVVGLTMKFFRYVRYPRTFGAAVAAAGCAAAWCRFVTGSTRVADTEIPIGAYTLAVALTAMVALWGGGVRLRPGARSELPGVRQEAYGQENRDESEQTGILSRGYATAEFTTARKAVAIMAVMCAIPVVTSISDLFARRIADRPSWFGLLLGILLVSTQVCTYTGMAKGRRWSVPLGLGFYGIASLVGVVGLGLEFYRLASKGLPGGMFALVVAGWEAVIVGCFVRLTLYFDGFRQELRRERQPDESQCPVEVS